MPRTLRTKVYKFSELSKAAKATAIKDNWDLNVDYEWWDMFEEDAAETYGIIITGFDLDRGQSIDMKINDLEYTAKEIVKNHGKTCDTYKIAKEFLKQTHVKKVALALIGHAEDQDEAWMKTADQKEDLEEQFKEDMERCYWKMLREEYEWRMSDEQVAESLEANNYEFTKDGKRF